MIFFSLKNSYSKHVIFRCTEIISRHITDLQLESDNDDEAVFRLPSGQSARFPAMFLDLEKEKVALGIANFGLDLTTMDDVFLKIGKLQENEDVEEIETAVLSPEVVIFRAVCSDGS